MSHWALCTYHIRSVMISTSVMKLPQKNSALEKILLYIGETSINLFDLGRKIAVDPYQLAKEIDFVGLYTQPHLSARIRYLQRSRYLAQNKEGQRVLTSFGRENIIKLLLRKKLTGMQWDGKWRAVIFDVPEVKRSKRFFLRRELRAIGLKEVQKSVWVTPYDIEKELMCLLKFWKIDARGGDVRILVIDRMMDDRDLRLFFGVKE